MELGKNYRRDGWRLVGGRWFRPALSVDLSELVRTDLNGRKISIEPNLSERVEAQLIGGRKPVVEVIGSAWCWKLDVTGRVWTTDRLSTTRMLTVTAVSDDPPPVGTVELSCVMMRPDSTVIMGRGLIDDVVHEVTILLSDTSGFHLSVQCMSAEMRVTPVVSLQGENLFELFDGHAEEARRYVRPLFAALFNSPTALGPGAGDVYRIFSEIAPDSSTDSRVNALLDLMDSPDPAQRDAAHEQLEQLGDAAVLSLMRLDRSRFRIEVRQRVDALITRVTRFADADVTSKLNDADFLIDCQYSSDARVRKIAAEHLQKSFGILIDESMTFDVIEQHRGQIGAMN